MMDNMLVAHAKLLKIVGMPVWFQRSTAIDDNLVLYANSKPPLDELERIPEEIDGIKIKIIYSPRKTL